MSDFYNKYPYTDFHELNLDWVIERVKKLTEDWAATLEEWNSTEEQWQELYNYVHNYFDNLDVQEEINNKINAMIADGTFVTITTPVIEAKVASMMPGTVASQIGATVASQIGATVASQIDDAVVSPVNTWLTEHITQPTVPVVDTSLSISGAAADAETTGDCFDNVSYLDLTAKTDFYTTGKLYAHRHSFVSGHTYLIRLKFMTPLNSFTSFNVNASTADEGFIIDKTINNHIIEGVTNGSIAPSCKTEIDILYKPQLDAPIIAYYLGSSGIDHNIEIDDVTDPMINRNNLKKIAHTGNGSNGDFRSIKLYAGIPYYVEITNNSASTTGIRTEVTALTTYTIAEPLERLFGGVVCYGVSNAMYEAMINNDTKLIVVNSSIADYTVSYNIYTDKENYNKYYNETGLTSDILGYKSVTLPIRADLTRGVYDLLTIMDVNFEQDKKYLIRFNSVNGFECGQLAFSTFNGTVDNYTFVEEGIVDFGATSFDTDYSYLFTCGANAESLMFILAATTADVEVYICEYTRSSDGLYEKYINPIYNKRDTSDPTIWNGQDGYFYCMGSPWTNTSYGLLRSADLTEWSDTGFYPFDSSVTSLFSQYNGGAWAPDCIKIGDNWLMYISFWGPSADHTKIAVCKSRTPFGIYSLVNTLTDSTVTGIRDSIDPDVVIGEDGHTYMFFGSQGKVHRLQLTDDGLDVASGATPVHVAGTSDTSDNRSKIFEGTYLYFRNGYWYMFVSSGQFNTDNYTLKVVRADSITGTFKDKFGNNATDGYATVIMSTNADNNVFYGPGHNGEIFVDKANRTYMLYHCHDKASEYTFSTALGNIKSRMLFIQEIKWDENDWPYFEDAAPQNIGDSFKM